MNQAVPELDAFATSTTLLTVLQAYPNVHQYRHCHNTSQNTYTTTESKTF